MELQIPTVSVDDLRQFHAKHFPHAPIPEHYLHGMDHEAQEQSHDDGDDGLGYYDDGVKRTLTDEEIAIFRHSEIQRILLERRRLKEAGEPIFGTHSPQVFMEDAPSLPDAASARAASPTSDQSTPMSISSDDEQSQATPVEQPQQKWAVTSEKTRTRNAKNRKKNRKNHRERKKEERKRQEREAKEAKRRAEQQEQDDESDEWDPWHQANGPDAQKEDAVDLDY
ncbi:uncharacterized protein N0V89_011440 [Didymosphaeria variabile]|uniref:Uncharacterized protein n=1 Tax=Didymosphaeria variabile TaxID=1932322 RepID=A0A9W8XB50_9PLEO|nr:uncharacterized protein N0V89_011440 [Didymosphaeria variabile]KAJ4345310.1 hypothetical protein N0V89_011440 [Didymosphaeria variabile]